MKQNLKERLPQWYKEITNEHKLILTNDLDSYFSCLILRKLFGCDIAMFYDFNSIYFNEKINSDKLIGVDLAIEDERIKTFCNHVTRIHKDDKVNPLSININNINGIHRDNYFTKYAGSTLLMILSLFNNGDTFKNLTQEQMKILMGVDSYFLGYYLNPKYEAYDSFRHYQKELELELFNDVLQSHTQYELSQFQRDKSIVGKIETWDLFTEYPLKTTLDLEYLKEQFPTLEWGYLDSLIFTKKLDLNSKKNTGYINSKADLSSRLFSFALTRKNEMKYTTI
ncbi:hypothetical protein [Schinkia azotoformans]|uniref:hypothetical protein n=1 Tax=Schinkia azotoformans TaxID=1454 RepID=UPI002DBEA6D1|nr:hypothetical protein [Schinkia azotoformans]MEC1720604.1 hypothetical protein [Schinkia azotoformans]MED4411743.1 hypothetical protein [Schinkia azotoformans]